MTDYLTRALDQEDEEREEEPELSALTTPPSPYRRVSARTSEEEQSETAAKWIRPEGAAPSGPAGKGERQTVPEVLARPRRPRRGGELRGQRVADRRSVRAEGVDVETRQLTPPELPVLERLHRVSQGAQFARTERRQLKLTLPEPERAGSPFDAEQLDRAVERDARRYDGGFALY